MVTCTYCGVEIDQRHAYQRVTGWEKPRRSGGANQITLRATLPEWACDPCIRKRRHGIGEGQGSLL